MYVFSLTYYAVSAIRQSAHHLRPYTNPSRSHHQHPLRLSYVTHSTFCIHVYVYMYTTRVIKSRIMR
jgi:hypothetical protein